MSYEIKDEELNRIYDEYCENDGKMTSKEVQDTYSKHNTALEEYIASVVEDNFKKGFQHAMRLLGREVQ